MYILDSGRRGSSDRQPEGVRGDVIQLYLRLHMAEPGAAGDQPGVRHHWRGRGHLPDVPRPHLRGLHGGQRLLHEEGGAGGERHGRLLSR